MPPPSFLVFLFNLNAIRNTKVIKYLQKII